MLSRFFSRLVQSLILLFGVAAIGFSLMHLAPGGPLSFYAGSPSMTPEDIERLRVSLGLDQPLWVQFFSWLKGMLSGDWGYSFFGGRPVIDIVLERLPATLELMGLGMLLAMLLGVSLGVAAALRQHSLFDHFVTTLAMISLSLPTFWLALLSIYVFGQTLGWLPVGGRSTMGGTGGIVDHIRHLILPVSVLALLLSATWSRYARAAMLEVLGEDYMRTARAKGLSPGRILWRHGLRSALLPLIALAGVQLPMLAAGALVTETVFAWPGTGLLFLNALSYRDYPILMAVLMLTAVLAVVGNLLADVGVALADPRVRRRDGQ